MTFIYYNFPDAVRIFSKKRANTIIETTRKEVSLINKKCGWRKISFKIQVVFPFLVTVAITIEK